eukprot:5732986-Heterocapsa_arctica.AAC.1
MAASCLAIAALISFSVKSMKLFAASILVLSRPLRVLMPLTWSAARTGLGAQLSPGIGRSLALESVMQSGAHMAASQ